MTPQELVEELSERTDRWYDAAVVDRDTILFFILLLLEEQDYDLRRVNFEALVLEAYRRAGHGDIDLQGRLDLIREVYPDAQFSSSSRDFLFMALAAQISLLEGRVRLRLAETMAAGGASRESIKEAVTEAIESGVSQVTTRIAETMTQADRIALESMGASFYEYVGPVDEKNRPFCADIVLRKRVYTPQGIERLNQHPLLHSYVPPNVAILCGGINCRHLFLPVTAPPEGWEVFGEDTG